MEGLLIHINNFSLASDTVESNGTSNNFILWKVIEVINQIFNNKTFTYLFYYLNIIIY